MKETKSHWEEVYHKKSYEDASWYQEKPETSLKFIEELELSECSKIIDVGGGDSNLVDYLLKEEYRDVSVLDISEKALEKSQKRLNEDAEKVNWIVADASEFEVTQVYHLWHDRAAFHFLTEDDQIENYLRTLENAVASGGYVILATFSKNGPEKCSGRTVKQYSKEDLQQLLQEKFDLLKCENIDHKTPSGAIQNFTFCCFKKK
ncbi:class I SAM-dependent methyltransferase [Salegentibacter salegens]|uniref:Methyltransferase domain-containing protein n=1 Tax=Salegentibacter salegens TaxID=143223 RepID=A0A1M7LJX9_9FLAO|nr:class I SAM-dependent methyltransferase [Salegentibacter salegens]PRX50700.1 methyltransferase family protein [Salegentibacter salegens]SHM78421.1 Methyltransferase domain-containing protein [Salegentibacter salegens]